MELRRWGMRLMGICPFEAAHRAPFSVFSLYYPSTGTNLPDSERTTPLKRALVIFFMLWTAHIRENSPLVLVFPLTLNPRNPVFLI